MSAKTQEAVAQGQQDVHEVKEQAGSTSLRCVRVGMMNTSEAIVGCDPSAPSDTCQILIVRDCSVSLHARKSGKVMVMENDPIVLSSSDVRA